jgi:hypothetical protein
MTNQLNNMEPLKVLIDTYKELLKIDNNAIRIQLQPVYSQLRDCIAQEMGISSQVVQENTEQLAIKEKYNL